MNSSKTIQFKKRVNRIQVLESPGSILCPVGYLKTYLKAASRSPSQSLFTYSYGAYNNKLKLACKDIGLKGQYSTHSVRRGSASYLSTFLPLHDVKSYGDWKSWAVLLYLADTYASRKSKDQLVSEKLCEFVWTLLNSLGKCMSGLGQMLSSCHCICSHNMYSISRHRLYDNIFWETNCSYVVHNITTWWRHLQVTPLSLSTAHSIQIYRRKNTVFFFLMFHFVHMK